MKLLHSLMASITTTAIFSNIIINLYNDPKNRSVYISLSPPSITIIKFLSTAKGFGRFFAASSTQNKMVPNVPPAFRVSKSAPCCPLKPFGVSRTQSSESFHVVHKVPFGDTPYVRAKRVQLVDKDPERAIPLFWAAINAGDRIDSALKDMALLMKQLNRPEEAIEAIRSLRHRCSNHAQEALDNILLDLFKKCGRLDDQIAVLKHKLCMLLQGVAFNGKATKTARSQGKKFQLTMEQEATRLLGNLGWALMQQENYSDAQHAYMQALMIGPDNNNRMCNLGICLMKQGQLAEATEILKQVTPAMENSSTTHLKAFERAQQMLRDLESEIMNNGGEQVEGSGHFDSLVWQPQPCRDPSRSSKISVAPREDFADENFNSNGIGNQVDPLQMSTKRTVAPFGNALNIDAPAPFYSSKGKEPLRAGLCDNSGDLKRSRSSDVDCTLRLGCGKTNMTKGLEQSENKHQRCSPVPEENEWDDVLPGTQAFEEAIIAAAVGSIGRYRKKVNQTVPLGLRI